MDDVVLQEDEIDASRAPLLEHLAELRTRLLIAMVAIVVAFSACFFVSKPIFFFLTEPFQAAMRQLGRHDTVKMVNTDAFGFFVVQIKVALFGGIILAFPVIAYQLYAFVAPGLYKKERGAVLPFMFAAPVMFVAGASFAYFIGLPFALEFALNQELKGPGLEVTYLPKVDEYLTLVTTLTLAFGFVFQIPVVLTLLARARMTSASALRKGRRYAIVGIAAFAACVTPPDVLSMTIMAVPIYLLYEISIWLVWLIERAQAKEDAAALA
ncbi:MAG: twin-arginine translocase subunit TatC [Pseudomonadota bacterium]